MTDKREVVNQVPVQRSAADQAVPHASSAQRVAETRQVLTERVRWPWLLSDNGILTVVLAVTSLGITALLCMWLIASDTAGADRANCRSKHSSTDSGSLRQRAPLPHCCWLCAGSGCPNTPTTLT
ncbi:hypothetical protein QLQ12_05745 [Actinoplanes sp. NEAU-A12]|uniref:Uncharacterized protein n=1 Tax=Actinoplanes sandaracinus TaxID=3045177 RepID=A0ABT6WEF3_9ACTN|nr:hypothetical protein [Actinoplanes sandaracinus]MDI6098104.1 hypothetical protein [Actinoplanes sandaracinus]